MFHIKQITYMSWFIVDPWDEMRRLQRSLDRVFDDSLANAPKSSTDVTTTGNSPFFVRNWRPVCDVKETDKSIIIYTELPGIPKEHINVDVHDGMLTISGERKAEKEDKNEKYHRCERSIGKFTRSMALPDGVDTSNIIAHYNNGILELEVPKPVQTQPTRHKITINSAPTPALTSKEKEPNK